MNENTSTTVLGVVFLLVIFGLIGYEKYVNSAAYTCAKFGVMEYQGEQYICTKVTK